MQQHRGWVWGGPWAASTCSGQCHTMAVKKGPRQQPHPASVACHVELGPVASAACTPPLKMTHAGAPVAGPAVADGDLNHLHVGGVLEVGACQLGVLRRIMERAIERR